MKKKGYSALIALLFILFLSNISFSSEPPKEPILRIETGMHTATITRIAVDSKNRYLVTGSEDKTIRVWELSTGRLIKTIRPPIGGVKEGKIYAVAISPDGGRIAAGGWTGYEWERSISIYIFDCESGGFIKRISWLPDVINHLTYSRDGRYLVACLGGSDGIRVYKTTDYKLIKEDKDYGDSVYGADFDRDGRLVTTSRDGYIRLYSKDFKLLKKVKAKGGKEPFGISFSPDGSKIVVGFADSTNVDVYSGKDLSYLYSPNTKGIDNGNLGRVTWSYDGSSIYAGGRSWSEILNKSFIRRWSDEGRGSFTDLPASDDTIMHILPLKNNGIVFGAGDPSFGIFDANSRKVLYRAPSIADFRDNIEGFLLSYDGSIVQFGYEEWGKSPARFSIRERVLKSESSSETLNPPLTSTRDLKITDWLNTDDPKVNRKPLKLVPYEFSRSLAIAPDGKRFLLGTGWYLRLFDRDGNEIWRVPAPGAAWAVNISQNGRVTVAAFSDGTIRWYRMSDGRELLTLFPHNDRKRWIDPPPK